MMRRYWQAFQEGLAWWWEEKVIRVQTYWRARQARVRRWKLAKKLEQMNAGARRIQVRAQVYVVTIPYSFSTNRMFPSACVIAGWRSAFVGSHPSVLCLACPFFFSMPGRTTCSGNEPAVSEPGCSGSTRQVPTRLVLRTLRQLDALPVQVHAVPESAPSCQ